MATQLKIFILVGTAINMVMAIKNRSPIIAAPHADLESIEYHRCFTTGNSCIDARLPVAGTGSCETG